MSPFAERQRAIFDYEDDGKGYQNIAKMTMRKDIAGEEFAVGGGKGMVRFIIWKDTVAMMQ